MFYNHRTKQLTGEMRGLTPEESVALLEEVRSGRMVRLDRPTEEELATSSDIYARDAFPKTEEEIEEAMALLDHIIEAL